MHAHDYFQRATRLDWPFARTFKFKFRSCQRPSSPPILAAKEGNILQASQFRVHFALAYLILLSGDSYGPLMRCFDNLVVVQQ